jgi:hypothetical protein
MYGFSRLHPPTPRLVPAEYEATALLRTHVSRGSNLAFRRRLAQTFLLSRGIDYASVKSAR